METDYKLGGENYEKNCMDRADGHLPRAAALPAICDQKPRPVRDRLVRQPCHRDGRADRRPVVGPDGGDRVAVLCLPARHRAGVRCARAVCGAWQRSLRADLWPAGARVPAEKEGRGRDRFDGSGRGAEVFGALHRTREARGPERGAAGKVRHGDSGVHMAAADHGADRRRAGFAGRAAGDEGPRCEEILKIQQKSENNP